MARQPTSALLLRASLALLCAAASSCTPALDLGFGVALTLHFDASVSDDSLAQVHSLAFDTDEPFAAVLSLDRTLDRVERTVYRPLAQSRTLSISVRALAADGRVVARGAAALASLEPGATAELDVPMSAVEMPDAAGADLTVVDLSTSVAPWTLIQVKDAFASNTLALAPTQEGSTIIVAITRNASALSDDAPAGGNVYEKVSAISGCADIWYARAVKAGATTITVTTSSQPDYPMVAWEVAGLDLLDPFDVGLASTGQASSTTAVGAPVTVAGQGEFIVSALSTAGGVSSIYPGNEFTNDTKVNGNGWAHLTRSDAVAGVHQAIWSLSPPGAYCSSTAAFRLPR